MFIIYTVWPFISRVYAEFTFTFFIYFSAKNNVRMVGTDTTARRSANVKMEELVTRLMDAVPAPQVGKVHCVINAHVLALNSMDLIAR